MFNTERKEKFIAENNNFAEKELYEKRIRFLFSQTAGLEEEYGKDLCDFSHNEIIDYYKALTTASLDRLIVTNNIFTTYGAWCLKNGYVQDGLNHYAEITSDVLNTCVNLGHQRDLFISRSELLNAIRRFSNKYEEVIVLGLYEGLDLTDLQNLTINDINSHKYEVRLQNERTLTVSKELISTMIESADTYEVVQMDDRKRKLYDDDKKDSPLIIKLFKERSVDDRTSQLFNIMKRIKANYGYPWLSAANLPMIGSVNMLLELCQKEKGKTAEEVASEHIAEFKLRYGPYWRYGKRMKLKFGYLYE